MRKKIVVTGGAGFIGSHVAELLLDKGHEVTVIDNLSFGYKQLVDPRAEFIQASVGDTSKYSKSLHGAVAVIHLAASSIIASSYAHPDAYYDNNVMQGLQLLEAMRKQGVGHMVYTSTSSVYGQRKHMPISENALPCPEHPYAASKLAFEHILRAYHYMHGVHSVSLRLFNVYGPRDEQKPATRAIPMWMDAIVHDKPVPWYWQGRQTRDYVYVRDVARACMDVMDLNGVHCFNIGSGKGTRMKDIMRTIQGIAGKKINMKDMGQRRGDPDSAIADITAIGKAAGWKPEATLDQGLNETYDYYAKAHAN